MRVILKYTMVTLSQSANVNFAELGFLAGNLCTASFGFTMIMDTGTDRPEVYNFPDFNGETFRDD